MAEFTRALLQGRALELPALIEEAEKQVSWHACDLEDDKAAFILSPEFAEFKNEATRKAAVTSRFIEKEAALDAAKARLHRLQHDLSAVKAVLRSLTASEE